MTTLSTRPTADGRLVPPSEQQVPVRRCLGFLLGGAAATFLTSYLVSDRLGLHHDVYLLVYATVVLGYLTWFVSRAGVPLRRLLVSHVGWSLAVGALVGLAVVRQVMAQGGTAHPGGGYFGLELLWRGVVYGTVDALVLAVFPAALAYLLMHGDRRGAGRKAAFAALTVVLSLVVSAAYHLGYATYRGEQLAKPLIGSVMWDLPAAVTGNPAGAVVAHAAVHTTAVVHQYRGGENHFLPPELDGTYPERGGGAAAPALATGWLVLVGTALVATRDRWRQAVEREGSR